MHRRELAMDRMVVLDGLFTLEHQQTQWMGQQTTLASLDLS